MWRLSALICAGVSNFTPLGALENPAWVGFPEWHTVQRCAMIG